MKNLFILFIFSFLCSCKESQPEIDDIQNDIYKYDATQGNWVLDYIIYKNKKLFVSKICNSSQKSGLKIEKDTAYLTVPCSPLIKYKINKVDFGVLNFKHISSIISDCKSIYLCDKNIENIDGKIFENYNRQILQNNSNIWLDPDKVVYNLTRYNTKIDTLIFIDGLGNKAIYYKNNSK